MTNGTGGSHSKKRDKDTSAKKVKVKDTKASLKRKGWLPPIPAQGKNT